MGGNKKIKTNHQKEKKSHFAFKSFLKTIFFAFCTLILFVLLINLYVFSYAKKYVYSDITEVPEKYTAIVPGAAVIGDKSVSFVLRDRIEGAMSLINQGTCKKFLVSGDHGTKEYDEVNAARKYVLKMHDISKNKIFMDHAGFSTYETMYRARDVFCVTDCCIVTQKFHIYRSVFLARKLGLDAVGYIAPEINRFGRRTLLSWNCREVFARVKAFLFIIFKPKPTYLGDLIPITGSGLATWE